MESSPETNTTNKPSLLKICIQLMKLRVIVLLQITAICAILVHDLLARRFDNDRTWTDTFYACVITVVGGTLSAVVLMQSICGMTQTLIQIRRTKNSDTTRSMSPIFALIFGLTISIIGSSLFLLYIEAAFWSFFRGILRSDIHYVTQTQNTPKHRNWWSCRFNSASNWVGCCFSRLYRG